MKFYLNIDCRILGHVVLYKRPEGQEIMKEVKTMTTIKMKNELVTKVINTIDNMYDTKKLTLYVEP